MLVGTLSRLSILCLALIGVPVTVAAVETTSSEYRLPPRIDPAISADVTTEIWARLYRPKSLDRPPYPLILFLHGNHETCGRFDPELGVRIDDDVTYTFDGTCPSGYVVTPNHEGYGYLAQRLAEVGYVVVSINANRGINAADAEDGDFGLNLRRGRLVLKHLQLLSQWNRQGGTPSSLGVELKGRLDLNQIGLMGHSRGGEGMRAALAQYRDQGSPWPQRIGPPLGFRALYEIGPVDGQTDRTLNASGVAWNVLLPYCDGDVLDLEGVRVFDRMLLAEKEEPRLPKSTFAVYGANHNFYNTEWQESDSPGCALHEPLFPQLKGSARQRATAVRSLVPFMRAHVGRSATPGLANLFDPLKDLPNGLDQITRIDRGYTDTLDAGIERRVDDFDRPTGTSSHGQRNLAQGITIEHVRPVDHDEVQRAAAITWSGAGAHLFQTNWSAPGQGRRVGALETLEFRVSRQCDPACAAPNELNPKPSTDFSIRLVKADGSLSMPVRLSSFHLLRGPVGYSDGEFSLLHPILATVRIPLSAFGLGGDTAVRGVRFVFDQTPTGAIYLANVRYSKLPVSERPMDLLVAAAGSDSAAGEEAAAQEGAVAQRPQQASIIAIRRAPATATAARANRSEAVEIEVGTPQRFPVTDALPKLVIGGRSFAQSSFGGRRTDRLVFHLPGEVFADLPNGAAAELQIGPPPRLPLGKLDKSMLR